MANEPVQLSPHQKNVVSLRQLAESPAYINRFKQVLNDRAPQFLASLVQLVSGSTYLAECDPNTIMAAAITSAALDLPIDKNLGFAHIVPFKGKASFMIGAKGLVQLAVRTGQYKFLNNCIVKDGELEKYDELTGEVVINKAAKKSEKVIGYAAYFKLMNGYEHAEFWYVEEIREHAQKYSQAYKGGYESPWKTDFDAMALKTVIKSLVSKWGIMSISMQTAVIHDQGVRKNIDSDEVAYPDNEAEPKRPAETGPPAIEVVASIETAAKTQIADPFKIIMELIQASDVNYFQVVAAAKKKKLAGCANIEEILQMPDSTLRAIIGTWDEFLKSARQIPKEERDMN